MYSNYLDHRSLFAHFLVKTMIILLLQIPRLCKVIIELGNQDNWGTTYFLQDQALQQQLGAGQFRIEVRTYSQSFPSESLLI